MSPLDRRRRRRRRRPTMPTVIAGVVAVIALLVLIGGALDVGRASGTYRRDVNRSYVAQGAILARQSNSSGAQLRALMGAMATSGRTSLRRRLDTLALASSQVAASAAALSPPSPTVNGFAASLAARARAVNEVRSAVEGLLGSALSVSRATTQIVGAGTLLVQADRTYADARRQFHTAPGSALLPKSVWVSDPRTWESGPVQTLAQQLTTSPTLAPVSRVVLLPDNVRITPSAVPRVTPGGPSILPPTRTLQVTAVVADEGNIAVADVVASARVTTSQGAADSSSALVSLVSGASETVVFPKLDVVPGDTCTLTVSVAPPATQADRSETSVSFNLHIAPASTGKSRAS